MQFLNLILGLDRKRAKEIGLETRLANLPELATVKENYVFLSPPIRSRDSARPLVPNVRLEDVRGGLGGHQVRTALLPNPTLRQAAAFQSAQDEHRLWSGVVSGRLESEGQAARPPLQCPCQGVDTLRMGHRWLILAPATRDIPSSRFFRSFPRGSCTK